MFPLKEVRLSYCSVVSVSRKERCLSCRDYRIRNMSRCVKPYVHLRGKISVAESQKPKMPDFPSNSRFLNFLNFIFYCCHGALHDNTKPCNVKHTTCYCNALLNRAHNPCRKTLTRENKHCKQCLCPARRYTTGGRPHHGASYSHCQRQMEVIQKHSKTFKRHSNDIWQVTCQTATRAHP